MKVKEGRGGDFERVWHDISEQARQVPGNLRQTLMRDPDDASTYVISTEWESREAYSRFEVSPEQDQLTAPLRALRESARQVVHDVVADVDSEPEAPVAGTSDGPPAPKGRIVFTMRLKPGMQEQFLAAYESMRYEVARGVPGHIVDQVCQSPEDPNAWLITSEWQSLEHFLAWERTEEHRELAQPLRASFAEARSLKYVVREETWAGAGVGREASGQIR